MNKILIWASNYEETGYGLNVDCSSSCTNHMFNTLGSMDAKLEMSDLGDQSHSSTYIWMMCG